MARPKKETVEYFPHDCNHGKTMFILEQKYGNDGYAFWFKLLEMLGNSNGHFLQLETDVDWEFLQAITRLSREKCEEILNLLAKLHAINQKLWEENIVWSDNFVNRIKGVYKNRRVETPTKPSFYKQKPQLVEVSTCKSTQSKVKETKVKETKVKEKIYTCTPDDFNAMSNAEIDNLISTHSTVNVKCAEYVIMKMKEYQTLVEKHGPDLTTKCIESLNNYKGAHGKKYKSDYRAILSWVLDKVIDNEKRNSRTMSKDPKSFSAKIERMKEW